MSIFTWVSIGVIVLFVIYIISIYNSLVTLKNRIKNGWAQIETQLQRRYDLIPNLVETVKGYAAHEKDVLENITKARAGLMNAQGVAQKADADNMLTGTIKSLFAVAENYPQLKADANFRELQLELSGTENKIAFARQYYNDTVMRLNTAIQLFPKNIIARIFGFVAADYYEIKSEAREPVAVKF
jgi:LemA protein